MKFPPKRDANICKKGKGMEDGEDWSGWRWSGGKENGGGEGGDGGGRMQIVEWGKERGGGVLNI